MGAWGIQLPENDLYADINAFYTALLRYGMNDQEALQHTLNEFSAYKNDPEDGDLLWLSLADILWNLGRLDESIKTNALRVISNPFELAKWYEISEERGNERKKILFELKQRLTSDQPAKKKIGKKGIKNAFGEMVIFSDANSQVALLNSTA